MKSGDFFSSQYYSTIIDLNHRVVINILNNFIIEFKHRVVFKNYSKFIPINTADDQAPTQRFLLYICLSKARLDHSEPEHSQGLNK